MKESMTMTTRPATSVDLDALVIQLITEGPENVSRPPGLPAYDFEQIQELMDDIIVCYPSCDLSEKLTGLSVYLRPPITLATGHQRAHQRHAPPLAAQKHQPQHRPNTPLHHRRQPQPHATTTTQLAQPPRPLQSTNEQPPLELAGFTSIRLRTNTRTHGRHNRVLPKL